MKYVEFLFSPGENVDIIAYGINLRGRVLNCCVGIGGVNVYEVEYANNNYIVRNYFYADQLAKLEVKDG